ncbi:MAG: FAD-dependent oxidoreductase [Acidobacteria bacterium]|nr:FAD-dependent oxidoreductase [Acidobacteriota bacterium]
MMATQVHGTGGKPVLVIGGGIAGVTTAVEAAEVGCQVILVETLPYLGGRVVRSYKYFPKLCPPGCGLEINFKRIRNNPAIQVLTQATVEQISGSPGDYEATIVIAPRFVSEACTLCDKCAQACPTDRADQFNLDLCTTKAAYLPHRLAFPAAYVIDRTACPDGCTVCRDACEYGAIDLGQQVERRKVKVAAVVAATGWAPYDATKIDNLGFGRFPNVVTNVIMERLAAPDGPTKGRILRPSDNQPPSSVAFAQCAGSRDENHLPYCSAVCCAASLKQATYVRDLSPATPVSIFYIDIRTPGRLEDFYQTVAADEHLTLIKGKVAKVDEDPATHDLLVTAEDVQTGKKITARVGLLVLATGIVPQTSNLPAGFALDEFRFLAHAEGRAGFFAAGCVVRPAEVSSTVQDATGAALKALQAVVRSAHHG